MQLLVFGLIQLILSPFSLIGLLWFMGVILLYNRPRGISGTAYEPLMNRVLYHEFGLRDDPSAIRLSRALPATRPPFWRLMMGPTMLAHRISGYLPAVFRYPPATSSPGLLEMMSFRTRFMDESLNAALEEVEQIVILGAGWDTRAYALPPHWQGRVYEVDAPATQAAKLRALAKAHIEATHVSFVAVDFHSADWLEVLTEHGFDREAPTFLLWEGVTMYLTDEAVRTTLRNCNLLPAGSRIAFDYFPAELIRGEPPHQLLGRLIPFWIWLTYGESFRSGIPMGADPQRALTDYLAAERLRVLDARAIPSWYGFALAGPTV